MSLSLKERRAVVKEISVRYKTCSPVNLYLGIAKKP